MHKTKHGHASLASDLIEEYRAPLIDNLVLEMINSGTIRLSDFYENEKGAVWMTTDLSRKLANAFSERIVKGQRYLVAYGDEKLYGFQVMIDKKLNSLVDMIDHSDISAYKPFLWNPEG